MQIEVKRKNYQRSIRSYIFLSLFLLAGAGYYGYTQYVQLASAQDALAQEQTQLDDLTKKETDNLNTYNELRTAYESEYVSKNQQVEDVFPATDRYTYLTIALEDYVNSLNKDGNPITMDSLRYGLSESDPAKEYSVLPIQISLLTTRSNFETFVTYIMNSGDLKDHIRLMEIKSITMNFVAPGEVEGQTQPINEPMLNVGLSVNAYFQKPDATAATPAA